MKLIFLAACLVFFTTLSVADDKLSECKQKGEVAAMFSRYRTQGIPRQYALAQLKQDLNVSDEVWVNARDNVLPMLQQAYNFEMKWPGYWRKAVTEMCFQGEI